MKKLLLMLLGAAAIVSCHDSKNKGLEPWLGEEDDGVNITLTETGTRNVYIFSTNVNQPDIRWSDGKGTGATMAGNDREVEYPYAGNYTISLTYRSPKTYEQMTKTTILVIDEDNPDLVRGELDPYTEALSGGWGMVDGKVWVVDSLASGHFGVGGLDGADAEWWKADALGKGGMGLYDDEMIFFARGAFDYINNGTTFSHEAGVNELADERGAIIHEPGGGGDRMLFYNPDTSNWKWKVVNEDGKWFLTYENGGFAIFYAKSPHKYEIITLTQNTLYLRQQSPNPGGGDMYIYYKYITKGYPSPGTPETPIDPESPGEPVEPSGDRLCFNDYESTPEYWFNGENVTANFSYPNPDKSGINTSNTVARYQREATQWGTRFAHYEAIDLSRYNKVRMKLYFPSTNDYDNGGVTPTIMVRMQNNDAAEPWVGEAKREDGIASGDFDKWIVREFDFSEYAGSTEFNVFIIQLGGEGHTGTGVFYMDDFEIYTTDE